jgi:hypothetical protein
VTLKRFQIDLLIIHPSLDPMEISASLKLDAQFQHRVGDQRYTPTGIELSGSYPDTRWRYTERYETEGQHFVQQLEGFVDALRRHKTYFAYLASTGGSMMIVVNFLGDGYFGDQISAATMTKLSELGFDLGIEVFADKQHRAT